ncbi:hypothetical protein IMZ48_41900 [Candidatus Bathyarchaeota archaeon]|nr:hypothetical protein [Candidatus Bathyarchaeota archaeon]
MLLVDRGGSPAKGEVGGSINYVKFNETIEEKKCLNKSYEEEREMEGLRQQERREEQEKREEQEIREEMPMSKKAERVVAEAEPGS